MSDILTGIDNQTYDIARVLGALLASIGVSVRIKQSSETS